MIGRSEILRDFLAHDTAVVLVRIAEAKGSTPRPAGTRMLVTGDRTLGTIGGGQLEFMAIDRARQLLKSGPAHDTLTMDVPLGPDIGQCCGGRVAVELALVSPALRSSLVDEALALERGARRIYLFGAGHVGDALARALAPLPFRTILADTRPDALEPLADLVETRVAALPEALVDEAPAGSAFVILTHDHALDFLIAKAALERRDAAYVGMIGSKSKRATFRSWFGREAADLSVCDRLICPIGGSDVRDKRPEVIAALVTAELIRTLDRVRREPARASGG